MRRTTILGTGLAMLLLLPVHSVQPQAGAAAGTRRSTAMQEGILEVLEQSQKSGKGVLVYLGSQAIGGAVTRIGEHTVELKNREYARIVIRLEKIDAVAGN